MHKSSALTTMRHVTGVSVLVLGSAIVQADCPGDLDGNGEVNGGDLGSMLAAWGACPAPCPADLDGNGVVNGADLGAMLAGWGLCPDQPGTGPFNYDEALQKALTFYNAQQAGDLPDDHPLNWRGDCFDDDLEQENGQYAVSDGILNRYMDAGDTPTFTLPISSAMTLMTWSGIEFVDGFRNSGQYDKLADVLRWHADWCMAAHPEPNVFCGQIGQGGPSHAFWGAPEIHTQAVGYEPKIWWLNPANPGSEPVAEAAAFLAAASMFFQTDDQAYAAMLLQHARELYDFANTSRGTYTASIPDVAAFYDSFSGYMDELAWSASWLYRATGEASYLAEAESHYAAASPDPNWSQSWDGKINGTACLLAALTGKAQYINDIETHLDFWQPDGGISYSPGGLAWLDTWGSLRYAANTSFLAFAYASMVGDPDGRYQAFGEEQINYILGNNPRNSSYVCGFGNNPPTRPHHRSAHGSWNNQLSDPGPNRHTLWGALVGGPASADDFDYIDDRSDYIANEVACDYNAGFTAALGRMSEVYGGTPLPEEEFPPVEEAYGLEMFVEAALIEDEPTFSRVRCMLNNRSAWPARMSAALSYRLYVDLTEVFEAGYDASDVVVDGGFTDGGTLSPLQSAGTGNLYYVEIDYTGELIGPGPGTLYRREAQVTIGLPSDAPDTAWNPDNDPSLAGLPMSQTALARTEMISVFDGGVLVFGEEGSADCNDNGIDDREEIESGKAADLDGNGRPDACDPDCNGDGVPDAADIMHGADDCNGNAIPDSCETLPDCDADGSPDACAISGGMAEDCNDNGIPDTCDLANGLEDDDQDGIPDVCQLEGIVYDFTIDDQWEGGFTASMTITNLSTSALVNWQVQWETDYTVINAWSCEFIGQADGYASVSHPEWSVNIEPGQSVTYGFQGAGIPSAPAEVLVNGSPASPGG